MSIYGALAMTILLVVLLILPLFYLLFEDVSTKVKARRREVRAQAAYAAWLEGPGKELFGQAQADGIDSDAAKEFDLQGWRVKYRTR